MKQTEQKQEAAWALNRKGKHFDKEVKSTKKVEDAAKKILGISTELHLSVAEFEDAVNLVKEMGYLSDE